MTPTTALILLAAGASRRMGRIKQLLPLKNKPAIRLCLHRILAAGIDEVVVVLGNHREKILPFLADLPVTIVVNDLNGSEMVDSVRIGREAVSPKATGIMIHPADQPLVLVRTYRQVAVHHALDPRRIIVPTYEERGGHPALFPASLLSETDLREPLNIFMQRHRERILRLAVDDPGVRLDMDYPAEYEMLVECASRQSEPEEKTVSVRPLEVRD